VFKTAQIGVHLFLIGKLDVLSINTEAEQLIERYGMAEHPEGGFYSVVYESDERITEDALPGRYSGSRAFASAIYYLLRMGEKSVFHRLKSDELWFHLHGGPLDIYLLSENKSENADSLEQITLGSQLNDAEQLHTLVRRGKWLAARPAEGVDFSLVSCVVMPGFEFEDFEMAPPEVLSRKHPRHSKLIRELT
jgi:hypothetical protein